MRILATLLRPDGGEARVFGHDVVREADAVRGRVSLTGQYASVDEDLTGRENLCLLARLLGYGRRTARDRAARLLEAFGLAAAADRRVKGYSGGMRRRLDLAAGLLTTPDLLVLDEPTTGLDPRSRSRVWDVVRAVAASGTTVLLTTQYLEEADRLAQRIAVIDRGRVVAEGTPGELKASIGGGTVHLRLRDAAQRPAAERVLARVLGAPVRPAADPMTVTVRIPGRGAGAGAPGDAAGGGAAADRGAAAQAARALAELAAAGVVVDDFALGRPGLEEVFLALTERPAAPREQEEAR